MPRYFNEDTVQKLYSGYADVRAHSKELQERYLARAYVSERSREFATHGFCRRIGTMVRAIEIVYKTLPPDLEEIPDRETVVDATIAIQSFVSNAFGCLDNLAWIWVYEKAILDSGGKELSPLNVGLGPKCKDLRRTFSRAFSSYLDSRQHWVDSHLKGLRDSFSHRIPLYIPPFIIPPDAADQYKALDFEIGQAIKSLDLALYDELKAQQKKLGVWRPWMTHSITEKSPKVVFHPQLVSDYMTIDEFGREMLEELQRQGL